MCLDALKASIVEAKSGRDTQQYRNAWEAIRAAAPSEPEAQFDQDWLDRTTKQNKAETNRLEAELKQYKNNLVRESIRVRLPKIVCSATAMVTQAANIGLESWHRLDIETWPNTLRGPVSFRALLMRSCA